MNCVGSWMKFNFIPKCCFVTSNKREICAKWMQKISFLHIIRFYLSIVKSFFEFPRHSFLEEQWQLQIQYGFYGIEADGFKPIRFCHEIAKTCFHVLFGQGASLNIFVNSNKLSLVFAVLWCSPLFKVILKISYLKFY